VKTAWTLYIMIWSLETFVNVLNCIYGCPMDVISNNLVPLFEVNNCIVLMFILFNPFVASAVMMGKMDRAITYNTRFVVFFISNF
jgi:hypothetical protein